MSQMDISTPSSTIEFSTQPMEVNEFRFFYKPQNDNNIYHVICKMVYYPQNSENNNSLDDDDYDFEFFYQGYHITCKLISDELIVGILNKEIYGKNLDVNGLKRKHSLSSHQKLNLELNLKQDILYPCTSKGEMGTDSNGPFHGNVESDTTQIVPMIDNQSYFDNVTVVTSHDVNHQDTQVAQPNNIPQHQNLYQANN